MADVNGVRDSLNMEETKSSLDAAVEEFLETTEKAMNATSKRQMRKYQKLREQQQKTVEDLMDDFESVFEVTSDGLDDLDRDMYDVFLANRRKDIKLYDTAYKQQMKKQTKSMKKFFSEAEDGWEDLEEKFSRIANIATALNVDQIKDSLEGNTEDTVDQLREIKKGLNLNDEEMKEMKKIIQESSSALSDKYGGMISSTDLTSAVNYVVSEIGVRDRELATRFGEELSVFKSATDLDYESIDELVKTIDTYGWDPSVISDTANELKKLTSQYEVSGDALTSALEQMNGKNERLSGGNQETYQQLESDLMKATTMLENSYVDSSKVFDKFDQDIGSFAEDMSWLAAGGADINKMYKDFSSGNYSSAISEFYKGIQGLEESGIYDSNGQVRRMIQDSLDITSSEWERMIANLGQVSVDELENQMQGVLDSSEDMLSKSINEASYKKWYQKALDKFGLSELGGSITNFIEGLDMDLADLFVIGSGAKSIFSFLKGKGVFGGLKEGASGLFGKFKNKFGGFSRGTGAAGSAVYSADDIAEAFGTSVDDVLRTFGDDTSKYTADYIADVMGTTSDDILSTLGSTADDLLNSSDEALRAATGALNDTASTADDVLRATAGSADDVLAGAGSVLSKAGKALGVIGTLIQVGTGIYDFVTADTAGEKGEAVGGTAGGIAGGFGGVAGGAALGSLIFPGVGTVIGGILGGIAGGLGGDWLGGEIGESIAQNFADAETNYGTWAAGLPIIGGMWQKGGKFYKGSKRDQEIAALSEQYEKENEQAMSEWREANSDSIKQFRDSIVSNTKNGDLDLSFLEGTDLATAQALLESVFGDIQHMQYMMNAGSSLSDFDFGAGETEFYEKQLDNTDLLKSIIDGSHRNGLDYVPYDGYLAELHKGEAVLTREQNRNGQNSTFSKVREGFNPREKDSFREVLEYALDENDTTFAEVAENFAIRFVDETLSSLRRNKGMIGSLFGGGGYSISAGGSGGLGGFGSFGGDSGFGFGGGGSSADAGASSASASANESSIYKYLTGTMGLNKAAASGVLGNIEQESSFDPNAIGDGGTSYGICQWHNSRWESLKKFCSSKGLDWKSLEGQLEYLNHELQSGYPGVYKTLKSVENTSQGAYDAAYKWCTDFEIPANKYQEAVSRGESARKYFKNYGGSYAVGTPWIPGDQVALIHKGEMIVPKKYNPLGSETATSRVTVGESLGGSTYKSLDTIIDVLRQGFAYLGKKIDGISIQVNSTSNDSVREATSPYYFSMGGGIL